MTSTTKELGKNVTDQIAAVIGNNITSHLNQLSDRTIQIQLEMSNTSDVSREIDSFLKDDISPEVKLLNSQVMAINNTLQRNTQVFESEMR